MMLEVGARLLDPFTQLCLASQFLLDSLSGNRVGMDVMEQHHPAW